MAVYAYLMRINASSMKNGNLTNTDVEMMMSISQMVGEHVLVQ